MRNVSDKSCKKKSKHTFLFSNLFFFYFLFLENPAVYEIVLKNIIERGSPQMTIWRMRIACWIPKATNTHTQVV
jgi:hypothetical protein